MKSTLGSLITMGSFPSSELTPTSWKRHLHVSETWLHHHVNPIVLRSASSVVVLPVLPRTGSDGDQLSRSHLSAGIPGAPALPASCQPQHEGLPPCPGCSTGLLPRRAAPMGSSGCRLFLPRLFFLEASTSHASAQIS